jgi:subtilisin family serine protease
LHAKAAGVRAAVGLPAQSLNASQRAVPLQVPGDVAAALNRDGNVRVIIGLPVTVVPEGLLQAAERLQQRNALAAAQSALENAIARFGARNFKRFRIVPAIAAEVDAASLDSLTRRADVSYVELDALAEPTLAESTAIIGAPAVWASGVTGAGQTVAILDTGVDRAHPFLGGRVVAEACYSTTQTGISQSVCSVESGPGAAVPCGLAACLHGTHVAGIAAGSGSGFQGVAPGASIIAIQVFSIFTRTTECGTGRAPCVLTYTSDQLLALQRVYDLRNTFNISSVNMSIGGGQFTSQATCDSQNSSRKSAIDTLRSAAIATAISSGNNGYTNALSAPGCISSAISVGSTMDGSFNATPVDGVSSYSNSAPFLSLLAPGQWITSSVPGGGFSTLSGTSMSAPHVTGAWALLKSRYPTKSVAEILAALRSTGANIVDPRNGISTPRIAVAAALNALAPACTYSLSATAVTAPASGTSGSVTVSTAPNCTWSAASSASFITVSAGAGAVFYSVAANPSLTTRVGSITIAGQTVTITQMGIVQKPQMDLNGDSRLDLLWQHQGDGRIAVWLMNGLTQIAGTALSPAQVTDTAWKIAGTGDLDGDGASDLVWQNVADGRVSAWLMNGTTLREGALLSTPQVPDTQWRIRAVGDVDGDGLADLFWQHDGDGRIAVWRMNGFTVLAITDLEPHWVADLAWKIVGSGDFDGNGTCDLVWQHQTDGRVAVWFMNNVWMTSGALTNPGQVSDLNWKIRAVGDLNGDGHPDLVWQNVADGRVSAWLMDGLNLLAGTLLTPSLVPDTNWHIVGPR